MKELTNCEKFRSALKPSVGQSLTTAQIKEIVWERYPTMPPGSNVPSEHAGTTNETQCSCAGTSRRIFDKVQHGEFLVLNYPD
jgi:hypothetical protein